jgi:acetylornithine deacetylase/succinyl-diaminopimelate desuccinylase-like protein
MKGGVAMMVAAAMRFREREEAPPGDLVLAILADEEAGGRKGAHWLVDHHPDLFADCTEAISEVGGFSVDTANDLRMYMIQTAEKGLGWLRLRAAGRPGHGSMVHHDNAVTRIAAAVSRIGSYEFPVQLTDSIRFFMEQIAELVGLEIDPENPEPALPKLGAISRMIGASLRNTATPTMLHAGYKSNVIPSSAEAVIDTRFLPGREDELLATIDELIGSDVSRDFEARDIAVETSFDGPLVDAMAALPVDRWHGRQVVFHPGYPLLRLRTASAARRPRLHRAVPRDRRASTHRRRAIRRPGTGSVLEQLLTTCCSPQLRRCPTRLPRPPHAPKRLPCSPRRCGA